MKLQSYTHLFITWMSIFGCIGNYKYQTAGALAMGKAPSWKKGYVFTIKMAPTTIICMLMLMLCLVMMFDIPFR